MTPLLPDYPMSPPKLKMLSEFWHPNSALLYCLMGTLFCYDSLLVYKTGEVCISILHPPIADEMSGERPEERWLPTQTVATIMLSTTEIVKDEGTALGFSLHVSFRLLVNAE